MRTETRETSAIFAANRAQGAVRFNVRCDEGVTRRGSLHESGSLRVRFPSPEDDGLSAVFVNTAGGIAGGDRFEVAISAGEGARLTLTTAAAEKVYRAAEVPAQLDRPEEATKEEMAAVKPTAGAEVDEFVLVQADRRYRVRGLRKNLSYGSLRLNVFVGRISYLAELERRGLAFGFRPGHEPELLARLEGLLAEPGRRAGFAARRQRLLAECGDPLPWLCALLEREGGGRGR